MSYHLIEDLIEDTICVLDTAAMTPKEKRDKCYQLLQFQRLFDTSYTHFRFLSILQRYAQTHSLPLIEHPDYELMDSEIGHSSQWLPVWNGQPDLGQVYYRSEDGLLYYDIGSPFWKRLHSSEPDHSLPQEIGLTELVHWALQFCSHMGKTDLFTSWYLVLLKELLDDLEPKFMEAWWNHPDLLEIRALGISENIIVKFKSLQEEKPWEEIPNLKYYQSAPTTDLHHSFKGRFLLDTKSSIRQLQKEWEAALNPIQPSDILAPILQGIAPFLESYRFQWCQQLVNGENITNVWFTDTANHEGTDSDNFVRRFIYIQYDSEFNALRVLFALQHGMILRWQKSMPGTHPAQFHCYRDLLAFLPPQHSKNKYFNNFGLLKVPTKSKNKEIDKFIQFFLDCLYSAYHAYFDYFDQHFPTPLFQLGFEKVSDLFTNGEDGSGIIPEYLFFDHRKDLELLFAFYQNDQGNPHELKTLFPNTVSPTLPCLRTPLRTQHPLEN